MLLKLKKSNIDISTVIIFAGLIALLLTSLYDFLLFHTLAELASISVAWAVFMLVWNTRKYNENNLLVLLGIAFLSIGLLDLLHTLAYKGMNIFKEYDADLPTQLWIASRYLQSISFLVLPFIALKKYAYNIILLVYVFIITVLLLSIFQWDIFPVCYIEGQGLTTFKIYSEYLISLILLISIHVLFRKRNNFNNNIFRYLITSIVLTIISELCFTIYVDVYGLLNLTGHFFKIIAFYYVYKAIIETGVQQPFNLLFLDLNRTNELLQNELREKNIIEEKLRLTINELNRSNEELEHFAYIASHDLKEPLRMVTSYTQLLAKKYKGNLDPTADEFIKYTVEGAARMQKLIQDLLEYSRLNSNEIQYQEENLGDLLSIVINNLQVSIRESNAKIIYNFLPPVVCNKTQIIQLFQNLLSNSLKFKSDKTPEINITAESTNKEYIICIKDNGIGIDPIYANKIFVIFKRLHSTEDYPGTGIGLAISKKIVENHKGRIWVKAEPGKGSAFYFTFPK